MRLSRAVIDFSSNVNAVMPNAAAWSTVSSTYCVVETSPLVAVTAKS